MCKCECGKKGYEWQVINGYHYFFISPEGEVLETVLSATTAEWSLWGERRFTTVEAAKAAVEKKYAPPVRDNNAIVCDIVNILKAWRNPSRMGPLVPAAVLRTIEKAVYQDRVVVTRVPMPEVPSRGGRGL